MNAGIRNANFSDLINKANFQADSAGNFTLIGSLISQWNDLSRNGNNATQATNSFRPTYSGGEVQMPTQPLFLDMANTIDLTTFSHYLVFRRPTQSTLAQVGSKSENTSYQLQNRLIKFQLNGGTNGLGTWQVGGEEYYQVISIRRDGANFKIKCVDRNLVNLLAPNITTYPFKFSRICGQLGSQSADLYIKAFCVSDQYFSDAIDSYIINYLLDKHNILSGIGQSILGFGDSITQSYPWLTYIGNDMAMPIKNAGITGTLCSNVLGLPNSGQDRWPTDVVTRPYNDIVCILYGANDVAHTVSDTNFGIGLGAIVSGLISKGYNNRNICVVSTPYQAGGINAATLDLYNAKCVNVASTYNTKYADILTAFRNGGGDSLMQVGDASHLHPNTTTGSQLIADTVRASLQAA